MKLTLNGEEINLDKQLTIRELIDVYELDISKIAVERNLELVPRSSLDDTVIKEGDDIEIIHFIGGG